jgi:natural product biosynthesis luciferase-like monooxygenase protein/amino acid adenylation domain-containing protein
MISEVILQAAKSGVYLYLNDQKLAYKALPGALTTDLKSLISSHKTEIVAHLLAQADDVSLKVPPISQQLSQQGQQLGQQQRLPLSYAQQSLWLVDNIEQGSVHYNIPFALKLTGDLSVSALTQAFATIVQRHHSLRSCFALDSEGQPYQWLRSADDFSVAIVEVGVEQLEPLAVAAGQHVFDLSQDLLLKVDLLAIKESEHVLLVTMHHIASDGWSIGVLVNEFAALYRAYVQHQANPLPNPLPELEIQYGDYAHWQRQWLQGPEFESQLDHWATQLADLPLCHHLPLDYARAKLQSFQGDNYHSSLDADTSAALSRLCQQQDASLLMGLHAAFASWIAAYSNETDIVIGTPAANREQTEIAGLIGFFVNTLVLRSDLSARPSFIELIQQSKTVLLDAYARQQVPFEQIVERLQPTRSLSFNPLFQVMLVMEHSDGPTVELPQLNMSALDQPLKLAKYDLTLNITRNESSSQQGLAFSWNYNSDLFSPETIKRMAGHFNALLTSMVSQADEDVFKASMLNPALLPPSALKPIEPPSALCLHQGFERQAARFPTAIAVEFEQQTLSYEQLNRQANQLAHYLRNHHHIKPDDLVGICLERSLQLVVAIIAVLKAGGAYVPLVPNYPESRLAFMLDDAKPKLVITEAALKMPPSETAVVCLDQLCLDPLAEQASDNLDPQTLGLNSSHLAYVIYTSGSTGQPKGVMVEHRNVQRLLTSTAADFQFGPADCFCLFHSFAFDFSVWELWGALNHGGRLVVVPQWVARSSADFYQLVQQCGVTILNQTPSAFGQFCQQDQQQHAELALRAIVFGGEALNPADLKPWLARHGDAPVQLVNMYGITETTVHVTYKHLLADDINANPNNSMIGRPLADLTVYVLNPAMKLLPAGCIGEMYVAGPGVTRGYLQQDALTASRFVDNPFLAEQLPGQRLYRTGDLACYSASGELRYQGRIDEQVKIRGFRIELGEIEHALTAHHSVSEAVVLVKSLTAGQPGLVAYVVGNGVGSDSEDTIDELRRHLSTLLPEYMLPAAFVWLAQWPLTANGKLDRKALPLPDMASQQAVYLAPRNPLETLMCDIWQQVLELKQVGINDNFFALGGHSLLVIQVITRLQQADIVMTARQLFLTPTVGELVAVLSHHNNDSGSVFVAAANGIPPGCEHITPDMLPLVALSEKELGHIVAQVPGGAANIQDIYPLGPLQQGILFHHMISTKGDPYVLPLLFKVDGQSALDEFLQGLQFVIERHDALRTAVLWQDLSVAVQVVCRQVSLAVKRHDARPGPQALAFMQDLCLPRNQHIKVSAAPLLAVQTIEALDRHRNSQSHYLLLQFHHLISDHVGEDIIQQELLAYRQGKVLPPPMPYREYIAHSLYQASQHDGAEYFSQLLGDVDEPTLPFDLADVQGDGSEVAELRQTVPSPLAAELRQVAKQLQVSPAVLFHSAWAILMGACSGRDDVVFGTVMSGRLQGTLGAEQSIGVFVNTLPLRVKMANLTVVELVRQVQDALTELLPYEQASLALAQRSSGLPAGVPLLTSMLNYRHSAPPAVVSSDTDQANQADITLLSVQERTNFPFYLAVDDLGAGFDLDIQVDVALDINRIGGYVQTVLVELVSALAATPELPVAQLSILPAAEREQLLLKYQGTVVVDDNLCIHQLFEHQAKTHPEAIALVCDGQQLSYQQLNQQANQLAHYLVDNHQLKPDTLVGICLERSVLMMVAILAVLKAGGAYVPMDPDYPAARLRHMSDDATLKTVITDGLLLQRTPVTAAQAVCLDDALVQQAVEAKSSENLRLNGLTSAHLAYVIYTSGSTGLPKGVMIEHRNVSNFLHAMAEQPGLDASDKLLAVTSTSFDIHVLELFLPLVSGAQLVIANKAATLDPAQLSQLLSSHAITLMQATPASWKMLLDADWQPTIPLTTPFKILCGGEALSQSLATALLAHDGIELWNMYGPTETTIWSSTTRIYPDDQQILLGRPIANTRFHVVNASLALVPLGVPGELLIGGAGLARGYFGQAELSAEKFIDDPFAANDGARLYKTGDLVRRLADGQIEYLGRLDHQVKVRGFRVELAEVEKQLVNHQRVKDAVVVTQQTADGSQGLVAYVVTEAIADTADEVQAAPLDFSLFYFGAQNGGAQNSGAHDNNRSDKYGFYLKSAQFADQHGFSAIWTPERHFDAVGALYPNPSLLSAALATMTTNIQLRAGSVVMPLHDPIRVAEEWSMVDNLSQGRVGMAVASGWHSQDFILAPDNFAERKQRVREGIQSLKTLWQGDTISRLDGNGQPIDIEIYPKPVQKTLPMWMTAAGNPQTFIEAGRQGTHVLTHLLGQTLAELTSNIELYRQSLAQHGHDPAAGQVTLMVHTFVGDDLELVQQQSRGPFIDYMRAHVALLQPLLKSLDISTDDIDGQDIDDIVHFAFARYSQTAALIGTPQSCLTMVEQIIAAGVNEVACLIDWMDEHNAYEGLPHLKQLMLSSRELTLHSTQQTLERQLRHDCYRQLPDYMVPSTFVVLEALPLTPNGKIDRKALPTIDVMNTGAVYRPPVSVTEIALSAIWQQVLEVERVGLDDNFFQLGGHSLLAMKLLTELKEQFAVDMPINLFFELPDLQSFAAYLATASAGQPPHFSTADTEELDTMETFKI